MFVVGPESAGANPGEGTTGTRQSIEVQAGTEEDEVTSWLLVTSHDRNNDRKQGFLTILIRLD